MEVRLVNYQKLYEPCNCACHTGKCNHTATPCHTIFRVREEWELELPNGETKQLTREWVYDDWKTTVQPLLIDVVSEILEAAGYVFFAYRTVDNWDDRYYYQRCYRRITPIKNCDLLRLDGISITGPWFGPTKRVKTENTLVVILDPTSEAEWEIYEYRKINVPHSVPVVCVDEETGEDYVMLEQCWGHREREFCDRYTYRNGEVKRVTLYSKSSCTGGCMDEDD